MDWIKCSERLPKVGETVKVRMGKNGILATATFCPGFGNYKCNWLIEDIDDIFLPISISDWMYIE